MRHRQWREDLLQEKYLYRIQGPHLGEKADDRMDRMNHLEMVLFHSHALDRSRVVVHLYRLSS
jgi:hypothetical protein